MNILFSPFPTLMTDRLVLRPLRESDAPEMLVHRSDDRITKYTGGQKAFDLDDALQFILKVQNEIEQGNSVLWAICPKGQETLIGTICIWNIDTGRRVGEVGFTLHPDYWGKSFASEALAAVIGFGFEKMEAEILEAAAEQENLASIQLLKRKEFVEVGEDGKFRLFALCRPPLGRMVLETSRLYLREIMPDDAPFLLELLNSPGWIQNIGDRNVHTLADANKYLINRIYLTNRLNGFSFYVMQSKSDSDKVGICGLVKRDFLDDVDIGYALLPQYYGKGYALEAAAGVVDFARNVLHLPSLAAIVVESNKPSIKLLEKLGMSYHNIVKMPSEEEELMLFKMDLN